MGLKWGFGDRQAGPCMGRCMGGAWHGAWVHGGGDVMMCGGKMHVYTTWIGEVGLGHWGRSGW